MTEPVKETPNLLPPKGVRWTEDDWRDINRAADILHARDQRETDASEVIRMGTRRYVAEVIATAEAV